MRLKILFPVFVAAFPLAAVAQGTLDSSIVPEEVTISEDEQPVNAEKLVGWAASAGEAANAIRVLIEPSSVTIVRLGERSSVMNDAIDQALIDSQQPLADLRNAFQINAVLVEILNQYGVGIPEIVGAEVSEEGAVTIYAFASQE